MTPLTQFRQKGCSRLGLAILLVCAGWLPHGERSAVARPPEPSNRLKISFQQPNTSETSAPRDRPRGGGTRPICSEAEVQSGRCSGASLTALVPFPEKVQTSEAGQTTTIYQAWGQTLEAVPTLWFYVPYPAEAVHSAVFEMVDDENQLVAQGTDLEITSTPGVIRYTPSLDVPLAVGETYQWNLLLRVDPAQPALDELVSGRIKRVEASADLSQRLGEASSPLQQATVLGEAGIWYDTVTTLASVYAEHSAAWADLLRAVGLEAIADAPLVDCCSEAAPLQSDRP